MHAIFSHAIDVRFRDCDPMGHVNNAVYLTYLEQARLSQWRSLWSFGERASADLPGVIVARTEIDYKRQARYGDVLEVRIGLAAVGRTSFTYEYEIVNAEQQLVAAARSVQVMFDYASERPVPIPDQIRRLFESFGTPA